MIAWSILVYLPLIIACWQIRFGQLRHAGIINILIHAILFIVSGILAREALRTGTIFFYHKFFYLDSLNAYIVCLTTFVAMTTAIYSRSYLQNEIARGVFNQKKLRIYYSLYPIFVWALIFASISNNMGVLWIAMEIATLGAVLLVSLYRTPKSLEAAWKYFILCGVGIAQALLGTIILYYAAGKVLGTSAHALDWTALNFVKQQLEPHLLTIAFIFLFIGYATKTGLVPLHSWLPDAHAEGPTPVSAVLSGLLLNVALYALLRCKIIIDGAVGNELSSHLMLIFGCLTIFVAIFLLYRQQDSKRLFAHSSIEHMGLMTLAFGLGGKLALFAGLLHMLLHSLTKSAIFFAIGMAAQKMGSQLIEKMRGLIYIMPATGIGLLLGVVAICGLPPFALFVSEFMLLLASFQQFIWLLPFLLILLILAFAILLKNVHHMLFSTPDMEPRNNFSFKISYFPMWLHLTIVLILGFYIPTFMMGWFGNMINLLS